MTSPTERLAALFAGYRSAHGTHGVPRRDPESLKWAIKSTAETLREAPTLDMWQKHLDGKRPLGIIPITEESSCRWGSIDYDVYDADLIDLISRAERAKLPLVPCRSKSGGLHLFLFLDSYVQADLVQSVLRGMAAQLGIAGSEIYPKQTRILSDRGDLGNWIIMPYFGDTFGGKIQEQVGLKRTGAEMLLKEFLSAAEKAAITEERLAEFGRSSVSGAKPSSGGKEKSGRDRAANVNLSGIDFSDGPPCLQHMAADGVPKGGQSNTLLMMGIYYKKVDPMNWKQLLEEAGRRLLVPPSTAEGMQTVIRSLEKKDYQYTCKLDPMASHCNSAICRTRRFGVGEEGNFPVLTGLTKLETDPPIWFADVENERLELSTLQLQNYSMFHLACMERVHRSYRAMAQKDWVMVVGAAMENLIVIKAPPDAGEGGRFLELLEEFCTDRNAGTTEKDLLSKRPFHDEDDERYYFRMRDFQKFLKTEDVKDLTRSRIMRRIESMGGGAHFFNIDNKKGVRAWWVPDEAFQRMPELDTPAREDDGV